MRHPTNQPTRKKKNSRTDEIWKQAGYTHKWKYRRTYLKLYTNVEVGYEDGAVFTDSNGKFRYVPWTATIEL